MQGTDEWKACKRRQIFVSGTTVQSICNEHPFRNADDVFNDINGTRPHFAGNNYSALGQLMEPVIVQKYMAQTGTTVDTDLPIHHLPHWPNVGVSPDGVVRGHGQLPDRPIEIKYAPSRIIVRGTVPLYYAGQLQLTLHIFNVDMMDFVQMGLDGVLDIIPITRIPGWFDARREKIQSFIDRVEDYRKTHPHWEQDYLRWDEDVVERS